MAQILFPTIHKSRARAQSSLLFIGLYCSIASGDIAQAGGGSVGTPIKHFNYAELQVEIKLAIPPRTDVAGLRLDANQTIQFPPGIAAQFSEPRNIGTLIVRGECFSAKQSAILELKDHDKVSDDMLQTVLVSCQGENPSTFEARFTLYCRGTAWLSIAGPEGDAFDEIAHLYVRDRFGNQQIPYPGYQRFWYTTCVGDRLVVLDGPI